MASRALFDLQPSFRERAYAFNKACQARKFDVLIFCTLRSNEEQAILYRQSRPLHQIQDKADELRKEFGRPDLADILMGVGPHSGPHVTNAAPGQSLHQYGLAFDGVPMVGGKPMWGRATPYESGIWLTYGEIAESVGLEWAGRWTSFPEYPHCQDPAADWHELIRSHPASLRPTK